MLEHILQSCFRFNVPPWLSGASEESKQRAREVCARQCEEKSSCVDADWSAKNTKKNFSENLYVEVSSKRSALYLWPNSRRRREGWRGRGKKNSSKQIYEPWRDKLVFFNSMLN